MKKKSDLEKLQDKWYAKLKSKGFADIEDRQGRLKTWSTKLFSYYKSDAWEAKRKYYQMAENFLNEYKFNTHLEKAIWTYHVEGISCRNISKLLKKLRLATLSKTPVFDIIKRLRKSMFAMYLTPHEEYHE